MESLDCGSLRRQNRGLKAAIVALLLALGAVSWIGATFQELPPKRVEAREFLLNDEHGNVRARLSMQNGQPRLELYDEHGAVTWSTAGRLQPVR